MTLSPPLLAALGAILALLLGGGVVALLSARRLHAERTRHADEVAALQARLAETREALSAAQAHHEAVSEACDRYHQWWQEEKAARERVATELSELGASHAELATTLEQKQHHFAEQLRLLRESRDQLKQEFENLANDILERKGKAFSEQSQQHLSGLLQPLHSEVKGFRQQVETLHRADTEQRASLRTELKHLQALNREITDQASRLTEALQGQKKIQGNWGELMLENVLEGSGLRPGKDYQREASFATDQGRRRPDAIVHLPQGKHLVIDAKTSLAAYVRYVNAEDDVARHRALAEHARAVSERIAELADKHYYALPGLNSPEVVVMFIPVESAYVEALKYDETLYQRAIESNVLVATPTTLLTSLNIVRQLWRFEDQSRHSAELAGRAEKVYNKLRLFVESLQEVGRKLDGARESYDEAMSRLVSGRGNLIKQAAEFRELGVAVRKELPGELVERAELELDVHRGSEAAREER
ncbi:DNA recombination protein RmuC [Billgrantia azerbaijanica]|nr:DNA recombination protein RmuC [Halomonas azerbaijanica]